MYELAGLYAITSGSKDSGQLIEQVSRALTGGARIVQYRDKSSDHARRLAEAQALLNLCHEHQVPLIVNDDIELACQIQADGIHLGQQDAALSNARDKLGEHCIIGISCYNVFSLAQQAVADGADYIAFGAFYPSGTKPAASTASPDLLHRAKQELDIPVVAIGGITPHNAAELLDAGADMLAVIQGVFAQPDIELAARAFSSLFD
jgi:thiamine-phosphate pyrophosphorylase